MYKLHTMRALNIIRFSTEKLRVHQASVDFVQWYVIRHWFLTNAEYYGLVKTRQTAGNDTFFPDN